MRSVSLLLLLAACTTITPAEKAGVGAECDVTDDCADPDLLDCLTEFSGGYCGLADCESNEDCPEGSACVDQDGSNYCFLICVDKPDCNDGRATEEANCSANIDFVDADFDGKACVPPSGN